MLGWGQDRGRRHHQSPCNHVDAAAKFLVSFVIVGLGAPVVVVGDGGGSLVKDVIGARLARVDLPTRLARRTYSDPPWASRVRDQQRAGFKL